MNNSMLDGDVPMGFGMALAQNMIALEKFAALTQTEKDKIIQGTHSITSKQEMQRYVDHIADGGTM